MKKALSLLIILLMSATVFASCSDKDETSGGASSEQPVSQNTSVDESSNTEPEGDQTFGKDIEIKNLNGRVIRILCRDWTAGSTSIVGYNGEVIQRPEFDENTADPVDIAKYEVRELVESRYNCTIQGDFSGESPANFNQLVRNMMLGGSDESKYDIVFDAYGHAHPLVTEGVYVDLNTVESIDFDNPWWDQNAKNDLSICNKLFFMCGDINTYDNDGTWVIYFNKKLASDALPGVNLYSLVENNQWTLDKFIELCKGVTHDSDGVEGLDEFDTWGFGTEAYNAYVHVLASGQRICRKNSDDVPYLDFQNETMYTVLGDVMSFYTDINAVMVANGGRFDGKGYANIWEETIIKAFRESRELFYMGGLINIVGYRSLDFDFGILPIPKYTSDQDEYYHSVSMHNMSVMLLPDVSADYYDLGLVIEALGAESRNTLTPVYYEKCLKGKDANTAEDEKMLDIIFNSRCYDLGSVFNWGGVISQFMTIDTNYASRFDSIIDSANQALQETLDQINK